MIGEDIMNYLVLKRGVVHPRFPIKDALKTMKIGRLPKRMRSVYTGCVFGHSAKLKVSTSSTSITSMYKTLKIGLSGVL
jgi:hypothetical protein